jgi:ferrous iron transport protein A
MSIEVRLCDLPPGSQARVVRVGDGVPPAAAQRLRDLGFSVGTGVDVVRRAPLRDPVLYRVKDTEICLRRDLAAGVLVEVGHP